MKHFKLVYKSFPDCFSGEVFGATILQNGEYVIVIDSNAPDEKKKECLRHELAHIALDHFNNTTATIKQIEKEAELFSMNMSENEYKSLMMWQK